MNQLRHHQSLTGANPVRLTMPLVTMDRGAAVANGVVAKNQATATPAPAVAPSVELEFDDFDGFTLRVAEIAGRPEPEQDTPISVVADNATKNNPLGKDAGRESAREYMAAMPSHLTRRSRTRLSFGPTYPRLATLSLIIAA